MKLTKIFSNALISMAVIIFPCTVSAGIQFGNADINTNNEVVFTVRHNIPGINSYKTLFKAVLVNGTTETRPEVLTAFPEQMEILNEGKIIQIRNRYGTGWYHLSEHKFEWKDTERSIPVNSNRKAPVAVSPDGKWFCHVEKTTYATGRLTITNALTGKSKVISDNARFSYKELPAKWQLDSSILVYEKDGSIYFANPDALFKGIEVSEDYRRLGPGTINSVNWCDGKNLVYIDGDMIYKISSKEFYTLGLYSGIIGKGTTMGRLPVQFRPLKDSFSVNREMTGLVLIQGGKQFTFYQLKGTTSDFLSVISSRPYNDNEASFLDAQIIWATENPEDAYEPAYPAVWIRTIPYNGGKAESVVYKLNHSFSKLLTIEDSGIPSISPEGSRCAFWSGSTIYVYNTSTWKREGELGGERIVNLSWIDKNTLISGGEKTVRCWYINNNASSTLMLSSAQNGFFDGSGSICADPGNGRRYKLDSKSHCWVTNGTSDNHKNVVRNDNYRVFCGQTQNSNYENAIYARTISGKAVTKPLFDESVEKTEAKKKVGLIFDAYDNADGLANILYELRHYNVMGTFFLNGEFIRRYPGESKLLSVSGNDIGSLFFSTTRLVNANFVVDEDFIRRGLARNEDEFFQATGRELSLFWHAPFYAKSEKVVQAGKNAGYTYIDVIRPTVDVNGYPVNQVIDFYLNALEKRQTGIIPVTVGIAGNFEANNLYENIDLLLSALLDSGYEVVSIRDIVRN